MIWEDLFQLSSNIRQQRQSKDTQVDNRGEKLLEILNSQYHTFHGLSGNSLLLNNSRNNLFLQVKQ